MVSPDTCGKPLRALKHVGDGKGGGCYDHNGGLERCPGFVVEIRLKEAQRKRRQSGRESNAVEDVRDSRALLQMVAEEVETRLEST